MAVGRLQNTISAEVGESLRLGKELQKIKAKFKSSDVRKVSRCFLLYFLAEKAMKNQMGILLETASVLENNCVFSVSVLKY